MIECTCRNSRILHLQNTVPSFEERRSCFDGFNLHSKHLVYLLINLRILKKAISLSKLHQTSTLFVLGVTGTKTYFPFLPRIIKYQGGFRVLLTFSEQRRTIILNISSRRILTSQDLRCNKDKIFNN